MPHQELLQLAIFVVIEVIGQELFERGRLDELKHSSILRLWRTGFNLKAHRDAAGFAARADQIWSCPDPPPLR